MSHLRSFSVQKYRGINGLELSTLAPRVNLFTGENGVGKTALIEALWLFHGRYNPSLPWNQHLHRGTRAPVDAVSALVPDGERIELTGAELKGESRLWLQFERFSSVAHGMTNGGRAGTVDGAPQDLPLPVIGRLRIWVDGQEVDMDSENWTFFQSPEGNIAVPKLQVPTDRAGGVIMLDDPRMAEGHVQRFSKLVDQGERSYLLNVLCALRPNVRDVEILIREEDGKPYVSATMQDGQRRALHELGGGMTRLFRFVVDAFEVRRGIVFIDEIENGFHYKVLPNLWRHLKEISEKLGVQVFATTHSAECIDAAIGAFRDDLTDLAVHGLFQNEENEVRSTCFTGDRLDGAFEIDLELR